MSAPNVNETLTETAAQHIVAIGASAGGLEAIQQFFDHMPADSQLSFVIIQHLSSDHKSLLVELLSRHTSMKVYEAAHNTLVQPNCIYVIPNNKVLKIENNRLQLEKKLADRSPNTAIDIFLKSLAADKGHLSIAVILSGTGTDGTRGIEAIQNAGGVVMVQEPNTAKFDGMPNSAIAAGYADFILSPDKMPGEIIQFVHQHPQSELLNGKIPEIGLQEVLKLIDNHCGLDFYQYKAPTLIRRILRRMNQLKKNDFNQYLQHLRQSGEECKLLGKDFLIGVTKFFRDEAAFELLQKTVLADIVRSKADGENIKIWVVACSTGQEAYSIAIATCEAIKFAGKSIEYKIFATDIDADAVEHAAKGRYSADAVADVDESLLKQYFSKEGPNYVVNQDVRKNIVFAKHNIVKDPPFIKNDLISCRNMLIYMNSSLQRKVLGTLQYSVNRGGYLFLGPSEVPSGIVTVLAEVNSKWKLFQKTADMRFAGAPGYDLQKKPSYRTELKLAEQSTGAELTGEFASILTEEFKFAAIYIDGNYDVKEAVGDFRTYLSLPQKIMNLNLLKMVGQDLAVALNAALRKATKEGKKITLNNVRVRHNNEDRFIDLFIKPPVASKGFITIVFGEAQHPVSRTKPAYAPEANSSDSESYIVTLEEELKDAKLNLQIAVESLETTNEELQSSNEELLSANEELQSSNEELQSLNEELHTLNAEHQQRIKELIELNDDLKNYFRSSWIGQVFLDKSSKIRKFNPAVVKMINLIDTDLGRPIEHISTNLKGTQIFDLIDKVQQRGEVVEEEVETTSGSVYLLRILPYVKQDGARDGVVLTFVDLTEFKELNSIIKAVFNGSPSAIMVLKATTGNAREDLVVIAANPAAQKLMQSEGTKRLSFANALPQFAEKNLLQKLQQVERTGEALATELSVGEGDGRKWYSLSAHRIKDGVVVTLTDNTETKLGETRLQQQYAELLQARNSLKNLNNRLEETIAERTAKLAANEERMRLIVTATSDVVWDRNLLNNEVWWSDSFYVLFEPDKKAPADNNTTWLQCIHPQDRDQVWQSLSEAIDKGYQWNCRYRMRKKDGTYASVVDKGSVINDENGLPYHMVGAVQDVSQIEAAEANLQVKNNELGVLIDEFRFVSDFIPQMVWATLPDGNHIFYNKQWYDFTGLDYNRSANEGWSKVVHPDDQERALAVWRASLTTGQPYEIEYRFRRFDGVYRWFLGRALPMFNEDGQIVKWFGTCTDVHDQKQMSALLEQKVAERTVALKQAAEELEASNAELVQFASVASHDLKEPLRKIHIYGSLLRDKYLADAPPATIDCANKILVSSARMTRLINDLLAYSRFSISSFFETVSLNDVLGEVVSDLEMTIKEKEAIIECDPLPVIHAVPGQIRQLFQNLLSNSLKFSRPGIPPLIKIKTATDFAEFPLGKNEDKGWLRFSISDNGIGFQQDYSEKIFTIFQRLHSREKYEGTGIGLAIVKKIVEKHNGSVSVRSIPGEGTSFFISLPLRQPIWEEEKTSANEKILS